MTTTSTEEKITNQEYSGKPEIVFHWRSRKYKTSANLPHQVIIRGELASHIIKVKTRHNTASTASKTKIFKMSIFKNGQPEDLLGFLKNFKKAIDGTGTMAVVYGTNYLYTLLWG